MYLDYSKLAFDKNGTPETPTLVLKTMHEETIGVIPGVYNLKLSIKFAEPSEMTFDVPAILDGERNWIYDELVGYKVIYTEHYGIYVVMNPTTSADGISDVKHVQCYSLEKVLDTKKFFLEDGDDGITFKFFNQTNHNDPDTIIGRVLEVADGWHMGYVAPSVAQRYRTFDGYDDYLMSFLYGDCQDKFRCVFVFDPYERSINVYDADIELETLPIYLDFDNLVESLDIEEVTDELVTAIRPYGSDDVDIREVNPIGSNWIYDLSYFIANGDLPDALAAKWETWQRTVLNRQTYYKGLVALQASASSTLLATQAALADLKGELDTLTAQQSVTIQALAMETTSTGKANQQKLLDEINQKIAAKKAEIAAKEDEVSALEANTKSYTEQIQAVVNELSISKFFTDEEYSILRKYIIEQDITEDTFVATSVDTTVSGSSYSLANETISINGSSVSEVDLTSEFQKKMYVLSGGNFAFSGSHNITGDVIRGTLEVGSDNQYVLSLYAGSITVNTTKASSGTITLVGSLSSFSSDIRNVTVDGVTTREGSRASFYCYSGSMYLTANVSDYQKYSVQLELYDYALDVLADLATPTYEFSVDSANFVFAQEFAPFRNRLELGKGVYLNVGGKQTITPYIIEFELDFEKHSNFSIVFSNRFKRKDYVNTLKDMVETSYSTSRSFDASKYLYNQAANQAASVSKFMKSSLDAAVNTIIAAKNQSVVINGSGIHVGGDSKYQLRIVDSMIAMTDDNWATAKLAIGLFASDEVGTYFGVNAEVIGGKLIVGNNLVIENETDDGVMQFKVDSSGAWLNNSTFVLQKDNGGKILIDPMYGIAAGTGELYSVNGTTVYPSFISLGRSRDNILFDADGMPQNANFYLDIDDGSVYIRGKVSATSGKIGGFTIEDDYLHAGSGNSYVALNGSGTNSNSVYAIWAGGSTPSSAKFWVKKDGTISAKSGEFSGTLSAPNLRGNLSADASTGGWLIGCGINVGNGNFYVDQSGNVTMKGSINMSNGSITWGASNSPVCVLYASNQLSVPTQSYTSYPYTSYSDWHRTLNVAYDYYASYSYDGGQTWTAVVKLQGVDGKDGVDGEDGSDATVNERNVFNVLTNGGTKFGIFNDSTSNRLYINANYIRSGIIDADIITLGSSWGGFECARGSDGSGYTYGAKMYGSDSDFYFIATNRGVRMQSDGESFVVTSTRIVASTDVETSSDKRLKNNISSDLDRYVPFFMRLQPSVYRFNSGRSGRFHTGFIAQEVEDALRDSGLSTQDFAGLVKCSGLDDAHSKYADEYSLRYAEFISLNTYMIQRLYRRIDELEQKLQAL